MKKEDYYELARLDLKSRKNTDHAVLSAFSVGTLLVVTMLFALLAFHGGIMHTVNRYAANASACISYDDDEEGFPSHAFHDEIMDDDRVSEHVSYSERRMNLITKFVSGVEKTFYPTLSIGGVDHVFDRKAFAITEKEAVKHTYDLIDYIDLSASQTPVMQAETKYCQDTGVGSVLRAGRMMNDVAGEVVILSSVVDYLDLQDDDVIGKSFSYSLPIDATDVTIKDTTLADGIIVGVLKDDFFTCPARINRTIRPIAWTTSATPQAESAACEERDHDIIRLASFHDLVDFCDEMSARAIDQGIEATNIYYTYDEAKAGIRLFENILGFIGIVLLIVTLNSLFIANRHETDKRSRYLGMCRAVGMTGRDVITSQFVQNLVMLGKGTLISLGVSFIVCLAGTVAVNHYLKMNLTTGAVAYRISFAYYPLALVLVILFVSLSSLVMAFFSARRVARRNIVALLK